MARTSPAMPGPAYQSMRSRLDRAARETSDPQLRTALRGMTRALDDALGRGARPEDRALLRQSQREYRNALVLERAATGAGEKVAAGELSPAQLRAAVVNQNRRDYARGRGDLGELARAGQAVLQPLPSSGTAQRTFLRRGPHRRRYGRRFWFSSGGNARRPGRAGGDCTGAAVASDASLLERAHSRAASGGRPRRKRTALSEWT